MRPGTIFKTPPRTQVVKGICRKPHSTTKVSWRVSRFSGCAKLKKPFYSLRLFSFICSTTGPRLRSLAATREVTFQNCYLFFAAHSSNIHRQLSAILACMLPGILSAWPVKTTLTAIVTIRTEIRRLAYFPG